MNLFPVIGLMSGTSVDGIDACLIYTNGQKVIRTKHNSITAYSKKTKSLLQEILANPIKFTKDKKKLSQIEHNITIEHINVVKKLIKSSNVKPYLIGFHGQTIFHDPKNKLSIQLGDSKMMAENLKIKIVFDFRKKDLENGGQGAPLAPIYHKSIIQELKVRIPGIIINIGGITNLSYWDGKKLIGFDVGPGNNLMDNFMKINFKKSYDKDGKLASIGKPKKKLINEYCKDDFFKKTPPKSLERNQLISNVSYTKIMSLPPADCMATLSLLTAEIIKLNLKFLPAKPKTIIIVGGGQHNKFLVKNIRQTLKLKVHLCADFGLDGDFIEAELIGYLAARKYYNLPSTFSSTTGSKFDVVNGIIKNF